MTEVSAPEHASEIEALYRKRHDHYTALADALAARSSTVSNLRGLAFVGFAVFGLLALSGSALPVSGVATLVFGGLFLGLVLWQTRIIEAEEGERRWARVNAIALSRVTGSWRDLAEDGERFRSATHAYTEDLDIFGKGSLFQRLCVAHTRYGQERLADYLAKPAEPARVRLRQEAVRALGPALDQRQALEAQSLAVVERPRGAQPRKSELKEPPDPEPFLRWAEGAPELLSRPLDRYGALVLPPLVVLCIVLSVQGILPGWAVVLPLLGNAIVLSRTSPVANTVFNAVSATQGAFLRYGAMLELFERLEVDAPLIAELKQSLLSDRLQPSRAMKDFRGRVGWFDLRHAGLVHPLAAILLLWDVHCVVSLERWRQRSGKHARGWFSVLAEFEALSSLAGLHHDEPKYAFPSIEEGEVHFLAQGLGHPLIDGKARVTNDVSLPRAGSALLVTGSNMSGKSTLLRSMGSAAVLAFAGGPVAARSLSLSPCALCTSIRISDSLQGGVSHFYAEVKKLKQVVDATRGSVPAFFLLDEILHGTNSRERQIGARWVLRQLIEHGALGVVTTHDMELCRLPDELMQHVEQVHFRESVADGKMTFDYQLRPGPVVAGNALRLMQLVGLPVPLE